MKENTLESLRETFWHRATMNSAGCQEWNGAKLTRGYGLVSMGGKWKLAHRIAWQLTHGTIPDNLGVLHRCDNPSCVNPDHLFLGTQKDNNKDRSSKGRTRVPVGEKQNFAKLDSGKVLRIRELHSRGVLRTHIAKLFGVDFGTISAIVKRRTWRHVC